ncbi:BNR repeat-containing protein [uncultured Bacteroides sp.]|uniref:BNR repeat-containing protein n=1 Tax=uncultured Bacteroides sp. TaxID=162156 RepID=UPI002AABB195|nr:BNR repeat-containing protein [uncultured Bacteroides sp.]
MGASRFLYSTLLFASTMLATVQNASSKEEVFLSSVSKMTRIDKSKVVKRDGLKIKSVLKISDVPADFPVNFALYTKGNHQYVAYYDTLHQMVLASRKLNQKKWYYKALDTKVPWDSHNYISLFVDEAGYIHVVGNMHSSPMVYFKSNEPWEIRSMQAVHHMTGKEEDVTTYPEFMYGPKGEILFHYRYGRSGNGYEVFNVLNVSSQKWSRLIDKPLIDGEGERNAYMQGPILGPDGYFHLLWVWRETPDCSSNHTLSYARSKDLIHWESVNGEKAGFPITLKDSCLVVDATPEKGGLINIGIKLGFDSSNHVIVGYHKYDDKGNTQLYFSRYEGSKWKAVKQTNWNYRWDFKGGGTVVNELLIDAPVVKDGKVFMGYHRLNLKDAQIVADESTFAPLSEKPIPSAYPKKMEILESAYPGMLVYKIKDSGVAGDKNTQYVLRWEALSPNRDQKRTGKLPQPSVLWIYELQK